MSPAPRICSGVRPRLADAPPVTRSMTATASSPACSRRMSRTSGRYSMAWPSASMIGWSRRDADRGHLVAGKELHGAILALVCDARPMDPNDPRVRLERNGNVAVVTLDDPARRNALSLEVTVQLGQAVDEATADPSVGCARAHRHAPGVLRRRFGRRPPEPARLPAGHVRGRARALPDHPAVGGGGERTRDRRRREPPALVRRDPGVAEGPLRPAVHGPRHPSGRRSPVADGAAGRPPGRGRARALR